MDEILELTELKGRGCLKAFDESFQLTQDYVDSMPDVQKEFDVVELGDSCDIDIVGVSGFRVPLKYLTRDGEGLTLETIVTAGVDVAWDVRGLNLSRFIRGFYDQAEGYFTLEGLEELLASYREALGSNSGSVKLAFNYPILQKSLRSGLEGYQYYPIVFEGRVNFKGVFSKFIQFEYTYSSACPCSSALSEHARQSRNCYGVPHSQRSKATIQVEVAQDAIIYIEDLQEMCLEALRTETLVMAKREDEQAFAELNGAYLKFVEDAVRLLYKPLNEDLRIADFKVTCCHYESLHSYDVYASVVKGVEGGFSKSI